MDELRQIVRGAVDIQLEAGLKELLRGERKLLVKVGFDPTRPDLHLGHAVLLRKARDFQRLGHTVQLVVGDFTARIGDPSGRSATRPMLSDEDIAKAAETYQLQALKILDPAFTQVRYNSEWLAKMQLDEVIRLAGKYTLARMMERDDFKKRWAAHASISIHELFYPLIQAYDSVVLECDIELGGTDQLFNLLVGRDMMREYGLRPQTVLTTPILEGLNAREEDGKIIGDKMSKSLDNYVGIDEPAKEQFAKIMSISDGVMWRYYELLSMREIDDIKSLRLDCDAGKMNPRDAKFQLAHELASHFHNEQEASAAQDAWVAQFSQRGKPSDVPQHSVQGEVLLVSVLADSGLLVSTSEARRRIKQGAVKIDGEKVSDLQLRLSPRTEVYEIKAGKRDWLHVNVG